MKRAFALARTLMLGLCAVLCFGVLAGCGTSGNNATQSANTENTKVQPASSVSAELPTIQIGTLPTEDSLPLWVASDKKYFEKLGIQVQITPFQSAQELSAAFSSGAIQMAMTDIPVAATLTQSGVPLTLSWVCLGQSAQEGRFGILVGPNSDVKSLSDLKDKPIGVGSGTMLEYVMDKLMLAAGVPAESIKKEELKKIPVRFQLVNEGKVAAGVFPATLLELGQVQGGKIIADDTKGENLSQSVMAVNTQFIADPKRAAEVEAVAQAWDLAVRDIGADPESLRPALIEHARLPKPLLKTYPIAHYPIASKPDANAVNPVLEWMHEKQYLTKDVVYNPKTGELTVK